MSTTVKPADCDRPQACHEHRTPEGVRFVVRGTKPESPLPLLMHLATTADQTLTDECFVRVGTILSAHGYLSVSIDLPHHGQEEEARGHTDNLAGWARRVAEGQNFIPGFTISVSGVLDALVDRGYTTAGQITVCGTSRGGFLALHAAAADPRLKRVVCFMPVTDVCALTEFEHLRNDALAASMNAIHLADALGEREVWVCIGDKDTRVDTDAAIATARTITAAVGDRSGKVWLHVMPSEGHQPPPQAHEMAAVWLLERMRQ